MITSPLRIGASSEPGGINLICRALTVMEFAVLICSLMMMVARPGRVIVWLGIPVMGMTLPLMTRLAMIELPLSATLPSPLQSALEVA